MYYVYADVRGDGTPFYVGKGNKDRIGVKKRNKAHQYVTNKDPLWDRIVIFESEIEQLALDKEIQVIKHWGRRDKKTGILVNHTDGGEGVSGSIRSEEHKLNMSIRLSGKKQSPEHVYNKAVSVKITMNRPEVKEKIRLQQIEVQNRPDVKAKAKIGQDKYYANNPDIGLKRSKHMKEKCQDPVYIAKRTAALKEAYATGIPQAKISAKRTARNLAVVEYCRLKGIPYSMKITNAQMAEYPGLLR